MQIIKTFLIWKFILTIVTEAGSLILVMLLRKPWQSKTQLHSFDAQVIWCVLNEHTQIMFCSCKALNKTKTNAI